MKQGRDTEEEGKQRRKNPERNKGRDKKNPIVKANTPVAAATLQSSE